ncbi:MAG: histidine--tRNA ligase [Candidatus Kapaibacteriales bacterium]
MISSIRGTKDILPTDIPKWYFIEETLKNISSIFGFEEIRTPIIEKTEVFNRSIGEDTDIVNKEMYTFQDRGGDSITLRPEMTAAVVRAIIQNNLLHTKNPLRLWYFGPLFRYERPQKGRLRQFHQYGAELIGSYQPEADAEIILFATTIFNELGIKDYKIILNSLGSIQSRLKYKEALFDFFKSFRDKLSEESKIRLERNPLRILDSKNEADIEIIAKAPIMLNYLDTESLTHFETVQRLLSENGVHFEINPRLVRGLDYYTHSVFEFQSPYLGAQDSFGGGGRYNNLFQQFGASETPAVGFALGIERLLLILESQNSIPLNKNISVYIASTGEIPKSILIALSKKLRDAKIPTIFNLNNRSLKAQLREANKNSVKFVLILGQLELSKKEVILRNMENSTQEKIPLDSIIDYLRNNF